MQATNRLFRKAKILLINPWIYDFSAYNLWSMPLGLLKVGEYLSAYEVNLSFIDCTKDYRVKKYGTGKFKYEVVEKPKILKSIPFFFKRYGISLEEFNYRLKEAKPFDIVLITSIMSYWYLGVIEVIKIIRDEIGDVPIILGGIYASLYPEHAIKNCGADFIYKGPLEARLKGALENFGVKLLKMRNPLSYYKLNFYDHYLFAPLLTGEGCTFRCSYCASNILSNRYYRTSIEEVVADIIELYNKGVRDFAFYDDALLVNSENHIKPLLRRIIKLGIDIRFHTPNGLHACFVDEELASLMKKAGFKTIRLSLETINKERQKRTGAKVTNENLITAIENLKKAGFMKKEIGVYLMYGLPSQDLEEVIEGVQFLKTINVRINLTEFSPIKGTLAWRELVNKGIIDDEIDPLLTNNSVFSYLFSGYEPEKVEALKRDVKNYNLIE